MEFLRFKCIYFLLFNLIFCFFQFNFLSQTTLANTIEVITHAGSGGGTDVNSRMMMLRARRNLKQDMMIVNKRGGGGAAAMNYLKNRPADGNSILTFTVGHAITMAMGKTNLTLEEIAPIARGTNDPQILMVNCKKSPYKTPDDFVYGMKRGDQLTFGGTHTGTIDHITVYLWSKRLGQKMPRYIPYRGGGELAVRLVAGEIDVATLNLAEAAAPIEAGDICPLVILAENGMAPIPRAKTAKQLGIDLVLSTFRGFVTHKKTSSHRISELEKGITKAMKHSIYQAYLYNSGLDNTSIINSISWRNQIIESVSLFNEALLGMGLIKYNIKNFKNSTFMLANNNQKNSKNSNFNSKGQRNIYSSNLENQKLLEQQRKTKQLERKLALLEKERNTLRSNDNQKLLEEQKKRKELEKKLAALKSEKKKQIKKTKQKEIGSGFYVSKFRHIVTNQHVVNQCKKITVGDSIRKQIPADLIASDKKNDLAILQSVSLELASAETKPFVQKLRMEIGPIVSGGLMRSEDVSGGEEILVAGFPLGNMVSDTIKVTKGIVSATKGMDDDISQFEIDAVIRKGNSGGPIYDKSGNIVGVAVSRLNVNRTDTINFGIKGSTVKQFLTAHDITTKWSKRNKVINTKDLYKIASKQTVMVVCHN